MRNKDSQRGTHDFFSVAFTERAVEGMAQRQGVPQGLAVDCDTLLVMAISMFLNKYPEGISFLFIDFEEKGELIIKVSKVREIH